MRSDTSETCYVVARQKILSIVCTVPALSVTFSPSGYSAVSFKQNEAAQADAKMAAPV